MEASRGGMGRKGLMQRVAFLLGLIFLPAFLGWGDIFDYVRGKDLSSSWEIVKTEQIGKRNTIFEVSLVSQKWKGITWRHRLRIIAPLKKEESLPAIIWVAGSGRGEKELELASEISDNTQALVGILHDVPNQPLFGGLREDALISHTMVKFLESGDEEWLLLFPMVKSAIRAMDAVEEFSRVKLKREIKEFIVMGVSKRGWTTWLTAAVDRRVKGIVPIVYDNLNLLSQMKHQLVAWGSYSEKIHEYTEKSLPQLAGEERGVKLASLVDPYAYRELISIPKLIIIGTNDRYWPVDAVNLYLEGLVGETYLLYVPNASHNLENGWDKVVNNVTVFYFRVAKGISLPQLSWKLERNGEVRLEVKSLPPPEKCYLWKAFSADRDFRDEVWEMRELKPGKEIISTLPREKEGYQAFFGELLYRYRNLPFRLSTPVMVLRERKRNRQGNFLEE